MRNIFIFFIIQHRKYLISIYFIIKKSENPRLDHFYVISRYGEI
jgi:hypothetical protein